MKSSRGKKIDREKIRFPSKTDSHPRKGIINWWEDEHQPLCRKTMKMMVDKEIETELNG